MNKTTITILIIILLALGMWAALGDSNTDMPGTGSEKPGDVITGTDEPTETIDTSDWVTYRNEEMGFEVKHPEGWKVLELQQEQGQIQRVMFAPMMAEQQDYWWGVTRQSLKLGQSFEQFLTTLEDQYKVLPESLGVQGDVSFIQHDLGRAAILRVDSNNAAGTSTQDVLYIEKDDFIWSWTISGSTSDTSEYAQISLYHGLIDTLKFIDSSE